MSSTDTRTGKLQHWFARIDTVDINGLNRTDENRISGIYLFTFPRMNGLFSIFLEFFTPSALFRSESASATRLREELLHGEGNLLDMRFQRELRPQLRERFRLV